MYAALLFAALLIGGLLAVQASANLQLNAAVGTPYGASTLQLGIAAGLLALAGFGFGALGAFGRLPDVEWWHLLGGLASPLYITSGILLFPRLGALAAVGLFVTGQMFASLGLDLFGLFGLESRPFGVGISLGALAVLAGIAVVIGTQQRARAGQAGQAAQVAQAGQNARTAQAAAGAAGAKGAAGAQGAVAAGGGRGAQGGWLLLGLVAGGVLPVQGAVNARLRADLDEPLAVGAFSFIVATAAIAVVLAVLTAARRTPRPRVAPLRGMPWWGWLGGACAATYVTGTFMLIPEIGAAVTVALTVTGQQLASAVIDHRGLFRLPRRPLTAPRLIGLGLLLAGSLAIQLT